MTRSLGAGTARSSIRELPTGPGVYRFRDGHGRVLYVGRAVNLRRRAGSYWGELRDRRHLAPMVARIDRVEALSCDSEHEAAWVERNLLERQLPRWNRARGGAEVPVFIRLDERPGSPRLDVVHSVREANGARLFGPYLGGGKVRLAVSALHRVLPLNYSSDGLDDSGQELARIRGVGPHNREALVHTLTAVLERDIAALSWIRAELVSRRTAAAEGLAFELAGRLVAECAAVEWISATQRAASITPHDVDISGWAQGILVCFQVRAGRLCGWRQRPCTESTARVRVSGTPPHWREFAVRNAELAARLQR
jgi:excinuclease ABC subunit C